MSLAHARILVIRTAIGVAVTVAATWLLLPADIGGLWLAIGMFLIGLVGGAVMYWRWSPLLVPIGILTTFGLRNRVECPECPVGDGPPWFVGLIMVGVIMLIPAFGAAIGREIVGVIDEFSG